MDQWDPSFQPKRIHMCFILALENTLVAWFHTFMDPNCVKRRRQTKDEKKHKFDWSKTISYAELRQYDTHVDCTQDDIEHIFKNLQDKARDNICSWVSTWFR